MSTKYLPKYVFTSDKMTKAQHETKGRNKKRVKLKSFQKDLAQVYCLLFN